MAVLILKLGTIWRLVVSLTPPPGALPHCGEIPVPIEQEAWLVAEPVGRLID